MFSQWIRKRIPKGSPLWLLYRYTAKLAIMINTGDPVTIYHYKIHDNIVLEKYKFIYFPIPKVACSTLKKVCADLLHMEINGSDINEHIHYQHFPCIKKYKINKFYNDYFKFCFVRNPWARLVSCYLNKIYVEPNINHINTKFVTFGNNSKYFKMGMSFDEFVYAVCRVPDEKSDSHFVSQYMYITDNEGNLLVDYIGKIESFHHDFKYICNKIGLKFEDLNVPHLMKSKQVDYRSYYSETTKEMIRQRYSKDIEFFQYIF